VKLYEVSAEDRARGCLGNCQKCERPHDRPGFYKPGMVLRWNAPACRGHGLLVKVIKPTHSCIYIGDHYEGVTIERKPHFWDVQVRLDGSSPYERVPDTEVPSHGVQASLQGYL
jgi:hypothetical protein